jgi:hypothetical protein
MSNNTGATSPRFRLVMRIIGILVMIAPAIILTVAPAPIGFSGDYVGAKGMAFLFFMLSIPLGIFIIKFGKKPTRAMKGLLVGIAIWAGVSILALLADLVSRLLRGTL